MSGNDKSKRDMDLTLLEFFSTQIGQSEAGNGSASGRSSLSENSETEDPNHNFSFYYRLALNENESINNPSLKKYLRDIFSEHTICLHSFANGNVGFLCLKSDERLCKQEDLDFIGSLEWAKGYRGKTVPDGTIGAFLATEHFFVKDKECRDYSNGVIEPYSPVLSKGTTPPLFITDRVNIIYYHCEGQTMMAGLFLQPALTTDKDSLTTHRKSIEDMMELGNRDNCHALTAIRNLQSTRERAAPRKGPAPAPRQAAPLGKPIVDLPIPTSTQMFSHAIGRGCGLKNCLAAFQTAPPPPQAQSQAAPAYSYVVPPGYTPVMQPVVLPPYAPFPSTNVIYATKCTFTFNPVFAVMMPDNKLEIYNFDPHGAVQWAYSGCEECTLQVQRTIRSMGFMNLFVRGEHPAVPLAPPTPSIVQAALPPMAPFCEEQVLCVSENKEASERNFMIMRPDSKIGIYCFNYGTMTWHARILHNFFNSMLNNVRMRGITNPLYASELIPEVRNYVQMRSAKPAQAAKAAAKPAAKVLDKAEEDAKLAAESVEPGVSYLNLKIATPEDVKKRLQKTFAQFGIVDGTGLLDRVGSLSVLELHAELNKLKDEYGRKMARRHMENEEDEEEEYYDDEEEEEEEDDQEDKEEEEKEDKAGEGTSRASADSFEHVSAE